MKAIGEVLMVVLCVIVIYAVMLRIIGEQRDARVHYVGKSVYTDTAVIVE